MRYDKLVEIYEKLGKTTKRLGKTYIISEFLKTIDVKDIANSVLLLQGKVFPSWDEHKLGVASRLILKAINVATGIKTSEIEKSWKKTGDLGIVAHDLIARKKQRTLFTTSLTVGKLINNLRKLAVLEGAGTINKKVSLIAELLTSAKPLEAKYITRTVLEELRIGVGEGSMRDAIVWAFFSEKIGFTYDKENNEILIEGREEYNKYVGAVQRAYDLTNDFGSVVEVVKKKGLKGLDNVELTIGRPIKVMLAIKVKDIEEGFERVGKPAEVEYKYDGFRMQIHKDKDIKIFTRRLENVTKQFPEVVDFIKKNVKGKSFIIDGEAVGFDSKSKKYLPFQNISQRIKRKYGITELSKKMPVELNIFDILYYEGKNLIKEKFEKRRKLLEKIVKPVPFKAILAKNIVTKNAKEVQKFYDESLKAGNEGVMFKKLDAPYKPGARVGHMVKLKGEREALDLVITGAEWGEGKRVKWLSSFTIACIDEDGNFLEIGKVGTGIKEKTEEGVSFEQLTQLLKPLIIAEKGKTVKVKPEIVIEINYEEIQKSPTYKSGYALRFPRLVQVREDRAPEEISTLDMIEEYYDGQKKK